MSNRSRGEPPQEPDFDEPAPIRFGAGDDGVADEPGPILFGGSPPPKPKITPTPAAGADFDFEAGPAIALPSYITRAAQSWDPDSPGRAKVRAPEPEPPPAGAAPSPPAFSAPAEELPEPVRIEPPPLREPPAAYQPPPRRRTVPRPEPTYGVLKSDTQPKSKAPAQAELPLAYEPPARQYFTPLPEPGTALVPAPNPPLPPAPEPEPAMLVAEPVKPLIQIQINSRSPAFKGSGLMRGLFFGCLLGVAVGGIAAVLLDLMAPHPTPLPVEEPAALNAEVLDGPTEAPPELKAKPVRKGRGDARTTTNTVVEPPPAIRVQSAPPPRAVIRQGSGQPLQADPNSGR